jgi:hypothetical protein
LINLSRGNIAGQSVDLLNSGEPGNWIRGLDVSEPRTAAEKAAGLLSDDVKSVEQGKQLENPDAAIQITQADGLELLMQFADASRGLGTGDTNRFLQTFWETVDQKGWVLHSTSPNEPSHYAGCHLRLLWQNGKGELRDFQNNLAAHGASKDGWQRGKSTWGKKAVRVSQMRNLPASLSSGEHFDSNCAVILPEKELNRAAIWCFCHSGEFSQLVRDFDQSLKVTSANLLKIPFDIDCWTKIAEEQYPNGLPQPYTNDPTQWIFHGHPCGSVIWDEDTKWTAKGELRVDDTVLQVAVARLLGYRWPAELDKDMELAEEQRAWVLRCQDLDEHVDDDGIVCLPPVRGEQAADQRLEALLQDAYGKEWTTPLKHRLLETVGSKSLSLWLRDKFFEQHCKLFQNRPFIWHVWDGLKDGFSALVNYHQLDKAGLERLIYTYLGDWIRTQQAGVANGEDGADIRLAAAETLKTELEKILEGEKPYDIFVRWKPLAEQPIGWNPDLNDGVRLNIRPFLLAKDLGKKGAGILRFKPNVKWTKDRGKDVPSAPWYHLGLEYGGKEGDRINEHHLTLAEKRAARNGS